SGCLRLPVRPLAVPRVQPRVDNRRRAHRGVLLTGEGRGGGALHHGPADDGGISALRPRGPLPPWPRRRGAVTHLCQVAALRQDTSDRRGREETFHIPRELGNWSRVAGG